MRCPRCGERYTGAPALSRVLPADICPDCGQDEAIRSLLGMPQLRLDDWYSPPTKNL